VIQQMLFWVEQVVNQLVKQVVNQVVEHVRHWLVLDYRGESGHRGIIY